MMPLSVICSWPSSYAPSAGSYLVGAGFGIVLPTLVQLGVLPIAMLAKDDAEAHATARHGVIITAG